MEGVVLVKDRNLEKSEETNTLVEPTVGGTRMEFWFKDWATPGSQSREAKPG